MSESIVSLKQPSVPSATEPLREVLTKLLQSADRLPEPQKQLAANIRDLALAAKDPAQFNDTSIQRNIATAARDFEKATGRELDLSPAQRAEVLKFTSPATATGNTQNSKVDPANKPASAEQPTPDPIREVLTKLVANLDQLPASARNLATKIQELDTAARDPIRLNQKSVQHEIAYAAQDFEKAAGKPLDLAAIQRTDVTNLAGSAPGLVNDRMIELLRRTPQIDNTAYVDQIRRSASEIGQQRDQNTQKITGEIEQLENKVRLSARVPEVGADMRRGETPLKTDTVASQAAAEAAAKAGADGSAQKQQRPQNGADPTTQNAILRGGILDTLASAIRGNGQSNAAPPWEPQATAFGDRLRAFQEKVTAKEQDSTIGRVERSARSAMDALEGFRNTEGAAVMNRVQAAARAEPDGMAGVLSEMRAGGKFGDLRQAFNKALTDDKGFSDAYDRAASALARYGEGREKVEQILAKRPDAANLTAKFEQLDNQIGERATSIPSRKEGKNMLDDIGKDIAEIIQKATDAVRAVFTRSPSAGPSASPAG